jgi:4-aminobutyrate--pyruvate transaminase
MSNQSAALEAALGDTDALFRLVPGFQPLARATTAHTTIITRGSGIFVYDERGREYLEAASSFYVAALGYSDPELAEAANEQLRKLPFYVSGLYRTTDVTLALAERLAALVPMRDVRIAFACSGSEANDFLLKFLRFRNLAGAEPRRTKVIARVGGYHGATLAAASLTGGHHEEFGLPLAGILHTAQPERAGRRPGETPEAYAERLAGELEALLAREDPETVAAFIAEPVAFACGLALPPPTYWERVQAVLARHGVLCFIDEVVTGFGRTGNCFGSQTFDIRPHCMTLGKALSSGYFPISAVAMSGEFYDGLMHASERAGDFPHAGTHAGHPVGCAVALRMLEIIERRRLLDHVRKVGPLLQQRMARYAGHPLVADVRGVGLAAALEFRHDGRGADALAPTSELCRTFCERAAAHGLLVRGTGPTVIVAPPLVISEGEIEELFRRFDRAFAETEARAST